MEINDLEQLNIIELSLRMRLRKLQKKQKEISKLKMRSNKSKILDDFRSEIFKTKEILDLITKNTKIL
ncbi:MAG: hypothetical protein ACOC1K_04235 [Nanoarchaeota archaeon]